MQHVYHIYLGFSFLFSIFIFPIPPIVTYYVIIMMGKEIIAKQILVLRLGGGVDFSSLLTSDMEFRNFQGAFLL